MNAVIKNAAAVLGTVLCLPVLAPPASAQPTGAPAPLQVMTDTPEYCVTLRERLDRMPADAPTVVLSEVRDLETEGRRLCDSGETRGGILRMRRALMLMMHASREHEDDR
jgi:hypothetical protein